MDVLKRGLELIVEGRELALCTVIAARGSTPRHVGAKMIVQSDGASVGTIGGGSIEHVVTAAAIRVAAGAPAERVTHNLGRDLAMCCGGSMEVYIEPVLQSASILGDALGLWEARRPGRILTPLDGSPKLLEESETHSEGAPAIESGVFVEPVWPRDRLILFGCGHVARAIGPLASEVGFDVIVCDDNETLELERAPEWATDCVTSFELGDVVRASGPLGVGDYLVIVTRDHAVDQRILEAALPIESLTYIGLIGSLGKIGRFRRRIEKKAELDASSFERLHAPIGFDIGAETPAEIAVSVVAELIATRSARRPGRA